MRTKKQVWFITDLDYYSTEKLLRDSQQSKVTSAWKGRITFYLKNFDHIPCQVTNSGKFGISYPLNKNPEKFLKNVRKLLIRENKTPITKFEKYKEIPEPKEKITPLEEKVENAIDHSRFLLMRDPTPKEIGYNVGETPEKVREVAFKLAPKTK